MIYLNRNKKRHNGQKQTIIGTFKETLLSNEAILTLLKKLD